MRRFIGFILIMAVEALVCFLDWQHGALPPIGRLVDPIHGFWANATSVNQNIDLDIKPVAFQKKISVWMDDRAVPHIHAACDHDLYFMQGYLHAYYRLWQMDLETRAAAGRVSQVLGVNERVNKFDRMQRRKGMTYAAENSLKVMEAEPQTKLMLDAYTEGINYYISLLHFKDFPLEYKLMDFEPEPWTNLKSVLLLKYMADDLTGETDDIAYTYLRDKLGEREFNLLYPERIQGSTPVIPKGTAFAQPSLTQPAIPNDSVFPHYNAAEFADLNRSGTGSNNWAISPSRTQKGAAILCNDPHLALNLPSLWYEMQLQTPDMNVYGVSLPGAPGIVIGFNDSLSWGFTNNYRDVKDFYAITQVPGNGNKYIFNGIELTYTRKVEEIIIKNADPIYDTVLYTVHGPIIYDAKFPSPGGITKPLALCWMAHRGTNELLALYMLNKAHNYEQYVNAIMHYECPAQNMLYADRQGNIALWGQGQFVNKWKGQGKYIMNGADSATLWGNLIPMRENPHVLNPPQGYIASANQSVTDSTYPYWYNGIFLEFRAWRINYLLNHLGKATVEDMFNIQGDTYSTLAAGTLPVMLNYLKKAGKNYNHYLDSLMNWNYKLDAASRTATLYQLWWRRLRSDLWSYLQDIPDNLIPSDERTMQLMQEDTLVDIFTKQIATIDSITNVSFHTRLMDKINQSYEEMVKDYESLQPQDREWYRYKNTSATHLAKLAPFSFNHLNIGGWGNTINAAKGDHGPSWRMVVQMGKDSIEAYGIYPGGQSGNPGSSHYADFIDEWSAGKYYRLLFLPNTEEQNNNKLTYKWSLQP